MQIRTEKKHTVDLLFTLALFFIFAVSSLAVIVISSDAYRSISARTKENSSARTTLSYLAQKIRQNDVNDGISLQEIGGTDVLALKQLYGDSYYITYIYEYEHEIRELFIKENADFTLQDGKFIAKVKDFSIQEPEPDLYRFHITVEEGHTYDLTIGSKTGRPASAKEGGPDA